MDRARRARAEKLEKDQAERARAQQEAEAKARSREALFNTPFAGAERLLEASFWSKAGASKPMGKF